MASRAFVYRAESNMSSNFFLRTEESCSGQQLSVSEREQTHTKQHIPGGHMREGSQSKARQHTHTHRERERERQRRAFYSLTPPTPAHTRLATHRHAPSWWQNTTFSMTAAVTPSSSGTCLSRSEHFCVMDCLLPSASGVRETQRYICPERHRPSETHTARGGHNRHRYT